MAKRVVPTAIQLNDNTTQYKIAGKALSYLIRNSPNSSSDLYVGLNQPANGGIILAPGESFGINVPGNDRYYHNLNVYFKFQTPAVAPNINNGFMVVDYETDEEVC